MSRHRRVPPYPAWPALRAQGWRFWALAGAAAGAFAALVLVTNLWPVMADQHAEIVRNHENHEER